MEPSFQFMVNRGRKFPTLEQAEKYAKTFLPSIVAIEKIRKDTKTILKFSYIETDAESGDKTWRDYVWVIAETEKEGRAILAKKRYKGLIFLEHDEAVICSDEE